MDFCWGILLDYEMSWHPTPPDLFGFKIITYDVNWPSNFCDGYFTFVSMELPMDFCWGKLLDYEMSWHPTPPDLFGFKMITYDGNWPSKFLWWIFHLCLDGITYGHLLGKKWNFVRQWNSTSPNLFESKAINYSYKWHTIIIYNNH